jgi:hypothetical protein
LLSHALPPLPSDLTDRDAIGMSTMLGLSLPMLTQLLQCVAEAEGSTSRLQLTAPSGARVGAVRFADWNWFIVFTDHGEDLTEPFRDDRHDTLLSHGYRWENASYLQRFVFDTDVAFEVAARVIVGTLQHVYGGQFKDQVGVLLDLAP